MSMSFDERVLNGMGVLSAIVDSGSFAAAGEALDMSQSGVSRIPASSSAIPKRVATSPGNFIAARRRSSFPREDP